MPSTDPWYKACAGRYYEARKNNIEIGFATVQAFATYCKAIAPERCPVFGTPLLRGDVSLKLNTSVDRIDPTKGYVPGNIQIVSNRVNMMKSNCTQDELVAFAKWVLK
jgi:hypothetical protein